MMSTQQNGHSISKLGKKCLYCKMSASETQVSLNEHLLYATHHASNTDLRDDEVIGDSQDAHGKDKQAGNQHTAARIAMTGESSTDRTERAP